MSESENLKHKVHNILKDNTSIYNKAVNTSQYFIQTKAFKLLVVFLFYAFLYGLLRDIFLFFGFTSTVLVHMYLSWFFVLLLLWALLPQKQSYL